jgi:hypothetical protein
VLIFEEDSQPIATFVYFRYKKNGFRRITQPIFTQTNGLWINYPSTQNDIEKFALEVRVSTYFYQEISKLKIDYFQQAFHYTITNNAVFRWKDFHQTERQTFVIEDVSDLDKVKSSFSKAKKKHLAKAKNLRLIHNVSASEFYAHHTRTLRAKGKKIAYTLDEFEEAFRASKVQHQGDIIAVGDEKGTVFAALFVVWDKFSAYNLISTIDLKYKDTGASTLVVLEAIRFVADKTQQFDFEGSMIPEVANSFRQFGTTRKAYFQLEKENSFLFKMLLNIKSLFG